ncbi:MBOAT family O-acyltransferase [Curvivirga aplysinae]|uniref:MBOAT family O-acyltransferase n=1 Tax=Curvivirga aplysinae TaxID=2529852 RepID=UPI0012BC59EA|nr:MBOAT family O-acyltransferase [Curvivirga aplysinae]MTI10397.1 hypothetical protein [Curvivirga aplysinae]
MAKQLFSPKSSIITLFGIVSVLLVLIAFPIQSPVSLKGFEDLPSVTDEDIQLQGILVNDHVLPKLLFQFTFLGQGQLTVGEESFNLSNRSKYCSTNSHTEQINCNIVTKIYADQTSIELLFLKGTKINNFNWKVVKYKQKTTLSAVMSDNIIYTSLAFGLLFLLAFVYFTQSHQALQQWGVIAITVSFITINDAIFSLILLIFLFSIYRTNFLLSQSNNRLTKLSAFIFISIGFLLLFKYGKEGIYSIFQNPGQLNLLMPLGVSYFIIRLIDTQLRWYRGQYLSISFREFLFFIIFPGTLVAGPIENIQNFYKNRIVTLASSDYAYGLSRIIIGLFKKIVIADGFLYKLMSGGAFNSILFSDGTNSLVNSLIVDPTGASGSQIIIFALIGIIFAYVDFSSYSDIAIGFSRLLGYKIRENFNFPILAVNIREYWKRWHMSLSDWAFQNIFFPLMIKTRNSHIPVVVTMMTIGLWHAFNLSWFSWAIHHSSGIILVSILEKHFRVNQRILFFLTPVRILLTLSFASMGFLFVYFNDYEIASTLYLSLWKKILPFL